MNAQQADEQHYGEIDVVLLQLDALARRIERATAELRAGGAEDFLVEALEQAREELGETSKRLTQRTFFAVPKAQLTI